MQILVLFFNVSIFVWLRTLAFVSADCPPRTYGTNCSFACSPECRNGLCDPVTGNCSLCGQGHHEEHCHTNENDVYRPNYWPVVVGLAVALIILAVVFWRCQRMIVKHRKAAFRPAPTSSAPEENKNSANQLSTPEAERRPTICHAERVDKSSTDPSFSASVV